MALAGGANFTGPVRQSVAVGGGGQLTQAAEREKDPAHSRMMASITTHEGLTDSDAHSDDGARLLQRP